MGPYASEQAADAAMQDSSLVDGFASDDALDIFATTNRPGADMETWVVNLDDPD